MASLKAGSVLKLCPGALAMLGLSRARDSRLFRTHKNFLRPALKLPRLSQLHHLVGFHQLLRSVVLVPRDQALLLAVQDHLIAHLIGLRLLLSPP